MREKKRQRSVSPPPEKEESKPTSNEDKDLGPDKEESKNDVDVIKIDDTATDDDIEVKKVNEDSTVIFKSQSNMGGENQSMAGLTES